MILGWSEGFHDAGVAVIDRGEILFATHSERFTKHKHDKHIGKSLQLYIDNNFDISRKAFYEKPFLKKTRQFYAGQYNTVFSKRQLTWDPDITFHHHLSHAAAAFQTSPYNRAAAIVVDSIGEWDCTSIWVCEYVNGRASYKKVYSRKYPHSIGLWYTALTHYAGLKPLDEEYIFMGMAAYGTQNHLCKQVVRSVLDSSNNHKGVRSNFVSKLSNFSNEDIAYAAQEVLEAELLNIFKIAQQYSSNFVYGGGVALNCVVNTSLRKSFPNIWIMPNPGDAGGALGAACLAYGKKVNWKSPYLGLNIKPSKSIKNLAVDVVDHLLEHRMCGVAVNRAEYGPRALGNRSLLADPRGDDVKDIVNTIKRRQMFRPFAPVMLQEHKDNYFSPNFKSPHMSYVVQWLDTDTPAVQHVDGSARVQTVGKDYSFIRAVLEQWYKKTGCPVLLNTSLNIRGEPMVNDRSDADRFERLYNVKVFS